MPGWQGYCRLPLETSRCLLVVAWLSHPMALAQCGAFLAAHPQMATRPWHDTAAAAREVQARGARHEAAIAAAPAAARYGLTLLAQDIADVRANTTGYVVVQRAP